jgi:hypothetical protein
MERNFDSFCRLSPLPDQQKLGPTPTSVLAQT